MENETDGPKTPSLLGSLRRAYADARVDILRRSQDEAGRLWASLVDRARVAADEGRPHAEQKLEAFQAKARKLDMKAIEGILSRRAADEGLTFELTRSSDSEHAAWCFRVSGWSG